MVRAILDGRKTQTRRVVKPAPPSWVSQVGFSALTPDRHIEFRGHHPEHGPSCKFLPCPYGTPGDRLWVRETWAAGACADELSPSELHAPTWLRANGGLWYQAGPDPDRAGLVSRRGRWRPSIHMPRWASRITLKITAVRCERLQEIDDHDAMREGVSPTGDTDGAYVAPFKELWGKINGADSWENNPWVWVVSFKLVTP